MSFTAKVTQETIVIMDSRGEFAPAFEKTLSNAQQVKGIAGSLLIFTLFFGFPSVDAGDRKTLVLKRADEIFRPGGDVFPAKKGVIRGESAMTASGLEFGDERIQTGFGVLNRKGFFEDVSAAIAEQDGVFGFCIIDGGAKHLVGGAGAFDDLT